MEIYLRCESKRNRGWKWYFWNCIYQKRRFFKCQRKVHYFKIVFASSKALTNRYWTSKVNCGDLDTCLGCLDSKMNVINTDQKRPGDILIDCDQTISSSTASIRKVVLRMCASIKWIQTFNHLKDLRVIRIKMVLQIQTSRLLLKVNY